MKKLIFLWALCISLTGQAQTLKSVKQDLQKVIDQVDVLIKAQEPKPEEPKGDSCKRGPVPQEVYNITQKGATVLFDADEVYGWDFTIYQDGSIKASGNSGADTLKKNTVPISFSLSPGEYTIALKGNTCLSKVYTRTFVVPKPTGENPTPVEPKPGVLYPLATMTEGFSEQMKLQFRDSADVRILTDIAKDVRDNKDAFQYKYLINGHEIRQDKRLSNYIIAGNNPLRVLLMKINRKYNSIDQWGTGQQEYGGYYQYDAGESFSYNTSYPFATFAVPAAVDASGFLNHIPQTYDPSTQQVQWAEIGEDIKLPAGHFWGAPWEPWGIDAVTKKGVTHFAHHGLPWNDADGNKEVIALKQAGRTYSDFQRIEAVFGRRNNGSNELWPNGTSKAYWPTADGLPEKEAKEWARKTDASDALWLSEMSENVSWQPNGSPMFGAFYPELRKVYEENFGKKGIPYEIVHNYFWLGGEFLSSGKGWDYYKNLFDLKPKQLPQTEFSPGGTLSSTTMIVEGVYLNSPDLALRSPIGLIWRLEYFKLMGYHAGIVLFGQHETRPNNRYKFVYNDGVYYKEDKAPLDPNVHIASVFISQVYGNLCIEWGGFGKTNNKNFDYRWLKGDWFPNGSDTPQNGSFPHVWNGSDGIYYGFTGSADLTYFGHRLYAKTFGVTDGGERRYLRFRIDGKEWITPENKNANDIVNAYRDQRGIVLSQVKDGKIAWFYLNSFADNSWHKLEVELPNGKIVTQRIAGNGIHAKIEDL